MSYEGVGECLLQSFYCHPASNTYLHTIRFRCKPFNKHHHSFQAGSLVLWTAVCILILLRSLSTQMLRSAISLDVLSRQDHKTEFYWFSSVRFALLFVFSLRENCTQRLLCYENTSRTIPGPPRFRIESATLGRGCKPPIATGQHTFCQAEYMNRKSSG